MQKIVRRSFPGALEESATSFVRQLFGESWFSLHRVARLIAYDLEGIPLSVGLLRVWDEEHDRANGASQGTTSWTRLCLHRVIPRWTPDGDAGCVRVSVPLPESVTDVPDEARSSAVFGWNVRPLLLPGWASLRGVPHPSPRYLRSGWSRYCADPEEEQRVTRLSDAQRLSWVVSFLAGVRRDYLSSAVSLRGSLARERGRELAVFDLFRVSPGSELLGELDREFEDRCGLPPRSVRWQAVFPQGLRPDTPPRLVVEAVDRAAHLGGSEFSLSGMPFRWSWPDDCWSKSGSKPANQWETSPGG